MEGLRGHLGGPKGAPRRTFGKSTWGTPWGASGAFGRALGDLSASLGGPWGFRNDLDGLLGRLAEPLEALGGTLGEPLGHLGGLLGTPWGSQQEKP